MVSPDNGEQPHIDPDAAPPDTDGKRRGWVTGAVILGIVAIVGVAAGYVVSQFGAGGDSSLTAIPSDADIVIRFSIDEYGDQVEDLIHAFTVPLAEAGEIDDPDVDLLQLLDEEMGAETGFTFTDDILPWIGSDVSVGMFLDSSMMEDPDVVVAAAVADHDEALEFADRVAAEAEVEIETLPRDGGTLYFSETSSDQGWVWVGSDVMIITNTEAALDRSLETMENGESIATNEEYESVADELPDSPLMDAYVSSAVFDQIVAEVAASGGEGLDGFEDMGASGMAMTVVEAGIQFDMIATATGENSPLANYAFSGGGLVASLPANTFGYLGYSFPEGYFENLITQSQDQFSGEMEGMFDEMFGVSIFEELLPSIGPNAILAIMESDEGMIAGETGAPIGAVIAFDLSDPAPMTDVISGLEQLAAAEGIEISGDDVKTIVVEGEPVAAITVTENAAALATSASLLEDFLSGNGGLTESDLYQELDGAILGDGLQAFFDLEAIFDELPLPADERAILAPIRGIGAAGEADGSTVRNQTLILIDY